MTTLSFLQVKYTILTFRSVRLSTVSESLENRDVKEFNVPKKLRNAERTGFVNKSLLVRPTQIITAG